MFGIIDLLNNLRNYNISKTNNINFESPTYKIEKSKTYIHIPSWSNLIEFINKHNEIVDFKIENKKYRLHPKNNSINQTNYDLFNLYKYKYKYIDKYILSINSNNIQTIKKNQLYESYSGDNITSTNLNKLHLIKNYDYDLVWMYGGYSVLDESIADDRIEQKRLEINIKKLESLKYLKANGDMFYLISHLKIDATKEIILLLSYLFETVTLIKPLLYNILSSSIYIYAINFNKEKYKDIEKKINISIFKENNNINELSSLGINSNHKKKIFGEIDNYANNLEKLIDNFINLKGASEINLVANIAYSIGIPIIPKYINKKYEPYMNLYNLCSNNNFAYIKSLSNKPIINEVFNIYFKNLNFGNYDLTYNKYVNYDLIIIDKLSELDEAIIKLGTSLKNNKYLYIHQPSYELLNEISNKIQIKVLEKIETNIYKKIGYLANIKTKKLKLDKYFIEINDSRKYNSNLIEKIIPIIPIKKNEYKIYSISLDTKNLKINTDTYEIYPYYPIYDVENKKIYLNQIHKEIIDITNKQNLLNTIQENIKIIISTKSIQIKELNNQSRLIKGNIIKLDINKDNIPYDETNYGSISYGAKASIYAISKLYTLKTIFEFGNIYGNSSDYIKIQNPKSKLICIDPFESIIGNGYELNGVGIDKFLIKYLKLESTYKKMQKYENVELIKDNYFIGYDYLSTTEIKPELIFINFIIVNHQLLSNFLFRISYDYKETIIIINYSNKSKTKQGIDNFMSNNQSKYIIIKNENAIILVPINLYKKEIEKTMNEKYNNSIKKMQNDPYYKCSQEIINGNFKKAINMILDNKLDLNLKNKYIPNNGTLYHIFAYYLRIHEKKDTYLNILYDIEKPEEILNDYEFSFKEMLRYDTSILYYDK